MISNLLGTVFDIVKVNKRGAKTHNCPYPAVWLYLFFTMNNETQLDVGNIAKPFTAASGQNSGAMSFTLWG